MPVAEIKNAQPDQVFYESFEYASGSTISSLAKTGRKVLASGSYSFPGSYVPIAGSKMSYWYYNGSAWIFSGVIPYAATISSGGQMLDEIRAYPDGTLMSTYTYDPLVGTTSETDPNNLTTYYTFDIFGRLKLIKNTDTDIVKKYDYHYKQ
ncbi:MAG: repeat protein [Chitinophagaceae bacterium]|nr:repeat protein [Chitinophagaceae bacterium]